MGTARQIVLAARPQGKPQLTDFRLEETEIPTPASGQLLLAVQYLSLDPYMRGRMDDRKSYATPLQLGDVMTGESVARVLASKHPDYAEGDIVVAVTGWRTHALSDGIGLYSNPLRKLDPGVAPVTTALEGLGETAEAVLFVAGYPYDLFGAAAIGMPVFWHNRLRMSAPPGAPAPLAQHDNLYPLLQSVMR
jgi:hypothetical protein